MDAAGNSVLASFINLILQIPTAGPDEQALLLTYLAAMNGLAALAMSFGKKNGPLILFLAFIFLVLIPADVVFKFHGVLLLFSTHLTNVITEKKDVTVIQGVFMAVAMTAIWLPWRLLKVEQAALQESASSNPQSAVPYPQQAATVGKTAKSTRKRHS